MLTDGCDISLIIPKCALGIGADSFTLDLKCANNRRTNGGITVHYADNGIAPTKRLIFRYISE